MEQKEKIKDILNKNIYDRFQETFGIYQQIELENFIDVSVEEIYELINNKNVLDNKLNPKQEDNDFKAMAMHNKNKREERLETFESYISELEKYYDVEFFQNQGKYTITGSDDYGTSDYYPKADKLLIRKDNKWFPNGLNFLKINFLGIIK